MGKICNLPLVLPQLTIITAGGVDVVTNSVFPGVSGTVVGRAYATFYHLFQPLLLNPAGTPAVPAEGMMYYDSTAHKLKVYTGAGWETVTSA